MPLHADGRYRRRDRRRSQFIPHCRESGTTTVALDTRWANPIRKPPDADRPIERAHDGAHVSQPAPEKLTRIRKETSITNVVYAYTRSRDTASVYRLANCRLRVVTDYHTGDSAMNNSGGNKQRTPYGRASHTRQRGAKPSSFFLYL